jgi:SAM-dependent methyltransferase
MSEPNPRFWELALAVFDHLPRQGPGNRASAGRALAMCGALPDAPAIVDLGCGVGASTLHLAEFVPGASIVAIDMHPPSIERLQKVVVERGLGDRVRPVVGDMARPDLPPASADLVWSEGALYIVGLSVALPVCHGLLRPGGYLAFTEAVWRKADPPSGVRAIFDQDCPHMGRAEDVVPVIRGAGFELVGHFPLPDEAWWDDFYTPMEARIAELRTDHAGDDEALAILDELAQEPEMHRRHAAYYGYEFYVARRPFEAAEPRTAARSAT